MEMASNSNYIVRVRMAFVIGIKDDTQLHILFGCTNCGIVCFVEFGKYKLVYMYGK
jgi:hypothetical protein